MQLQFTHVYEAILAQLTEKAEETERGEPCPPENDLVHVLNVKYTEDEDKFVEHKVSEFVLEMLTLRRSQLAENELLYRFAQKYERAVRHVHERLKQVGKEDYIFCKTKKK